MRCERRGWRARPGLSNWIKLEVIGDEQTLFPDNEALLDATRTLVAEGFVVLPYTNDDPVVCRKLEDAGRGGRDAARRADRFGLGIQNPNNLLIIKEQAGVPVIVDAGVGTASDAAIAMELGMDGVLMNTAIAGAGDPAQMAAAMKHAVDAGRLAFLAGRIAKRRHAAASSPTEGWSRPAPRRGADVPAEEQERLQDLLARLERGAGGRRPALQRRADGARSQRSPRRRRCPIRRRRTTRPNSRPSTNGGTSCRRARPLPTARSRAGCAASSGGSSDRLSRRSASSTPRSSIT